MDVTLLSVILEQTQNLATEANGATPGLQWCKSEQGLAPNVLVLWLDGELQPVEPAGSQSSGSWGRI